MVHAGEPKSGFSVSESYAPFEPRVAFTYIADIATDGAKQDGAARPVYFERLPVEAGPPEACSTVQAALSEDNSGKVALSEYQWTGPGSRESVRRALDQGAAVILLLFVAPLLGLVALIIRLLDGPQLLVHDRRIGRLGREIDLLSFRTRSRGSPAMVRFGKFLRQSGISSLPRLINLLRGDLTLAGPRPLTEAELPRYGLDVIYYLSARPGMTGEWQGLPAAPFNSEARYRFERSYARTRTLRSDIKFMLGSLTAMVSGKSPA